MGPDECPSYIFAMIGLSKDDAKRSFGAYTWKGTNQVRSTTDKLGNDEENTTHLQGVLTVNTKELSDAFKEQKVSDLDSTNRLRISFPGRDKIWFPAKVSGKGKVYKESDDEILKLRQSLALEPTSMQAQDNQNREELARKRQIEEESKAPAPTSPNNSTTSSGAGQVYGMMVAVLTFIV